MSFTCWPCFVMSRHDRNTTEAADMIAVARDAFAQARDLDEGSEQQQKLLGDAHRIVEQVVLANAGDGFMTYMVQVHPVGSNESWPNETVWLPSSGISVGPCVRCRRTRPCVNT